MYPRSLAPALLAALLPVPSLLAHAGHDHSPLPAFQERLAAVASYDLVQETWRAGRGDALPRARVRGWREGAVVIGPAGGARGDACGSVAEARRALAARKSALGGFPFDPLKALEENPARGPLEYLGPRHERPLFRRRHADGVATELIALDPKHAFPVYWARFEEGAKVRSWRLLELRLNPGGAYSAGLCEGKLGLSVRDLSIQVVPGAAK